VAQGALALAAESRQVSAVLAHRSTRSLVGVAGALAIAACGTSAQSIYEGNVRFEHCYRLDLDRRIAPTHREMCWREWLATYSYGQTGDRVEHAKFRIRLLQAGETSPPDLDLDGGHPTTAPDLAPVPTSAHAPPPAMAAVAAPVDAGPDVSERPADAAPPVPFPRAECQVACANSFRACERECKSEKQAKKSCAACERDYLGCMRRCLR
jgi:hypothetical protein